MIKNPIEQAKDRDMASSINAIRHAAKGARRVAEIQERYRAVQDGAVICIPANEAMRQARECIKR